MDLNVLNYKIVEKVGVITMNNPPVNALDVSFFQDFRVITNRLADSGEVRAVLIASACPGVFSAGDDLNSLKEMDEALISQQPEVHRLLDDFESLPLPTVAAINGHALGGGLELALACDFRFMAEDSGRIGLPEVRLGMIPAFGGTQRLWPIVGKARAMEMMIKGLQLSPEGALAIDLVHNIWPASELNKRSLDYSVRLARQATGAIGKIKQCLNLGINKGAIAGMDFEKKAFRENICSADAKEGVAAFLENRKPNFMNR